MYKIKICTGVESHKWHHVTDSKIKRSKVKYTGLL